MEINVVGQRCMSEREPELGLGVVSSVDRSARRIGVEFPGTGEKRLRAYINAELDWASRMGPIALLVQYPMLSEPVRSRLQEKYGDEMRRKLEFHLAALTDIVVDIRTGSTTPLDYDDTNYPPVENAFTHVTEFLTATSISWASHGLAMWASGNHLPTQSFWSLDVGKISTKFSIKNHIDEIVATAKGR
jgi:hypothetical protein